MLFDSLFPQSSRYENIRKCETLFQIVFNMVHDDRQKLPLHVGISQSIYHKCLKQLIQFFNKLLCMSYEELERKYCSLINEIVNSCIENKVPLSSTITPLFYMGYGSFYHNENTLLGKESSHDTICIVF